MSLWTGNWFGDWFGDWFGKSEVPPVTEIPRLFIDFEGTIEKGLGTVNAPFCEGPCEFGQSLVESPVGQPYQWQLQLISGVGITFGQSTTVSGSGLSVTTAATGLTVTLTDDEFNTAETVGAALSEIAREDLAVSVGNDGFGASSADGGL